MGLAEAFAAAGESLPWMAPVLGLILGAVAGSFISCAVPRCTAGESLWHPPSKCDSCNRTLTPVDLVPVASWLVWRGRCRTCKAFIGTWVLKVEVISALVGLALGQGLGMGLHTFPLLLMGLGVYAWVAVLWLGRDAQFPQPPRKKARRKV